MKMRMTVHRGVVVPRVGMRVLVDVCVLVSVVVFMHVIVIACL